MAILWSYEEAGNRYEVRSAGASIRLYRNGVTHSQWNPDRPLSGSIWDLITLPALHRPEGSLQNVLMLGFGAGAVARQLVELAGVERVVGVEMDPMHLSIAQGFFDCSESCELVAADAVEWVQSEQAEGYDVIIDDLYSEEDGIPIRCAPMDVEWFDTLLSLLKSGGILVLNMIEPERVSFLAPFCDPKMKARLPYGTMFQIEGYENRVLAFSDQPFDQASLDSALQAICRKFPRCYGVAQRYQVSAL